MGIQAARKIISCAAAAAEENEREVDNAGCGGDGYQKQANYDQRRRRREREREKRQEILEREASKNYRCSDSTFLPSCIYAPLPKGTEGGRRGRAGARIFNVVAVVVGDGHYGWWSVYVMQQQQQQQVAQRSGPEGQRRASSVFSALCRETRIRGEREEGPAAAD